MRRLIILTLTALAALALVAVPAGSKPQRAGAVLPLPDGWQPEGIAKGKGKTLYVGSIPTGRVLALNAKTGATREVVPQREGRAAIGLKHHRGRLFVAGGPTGHAFVYHARTGETLRDIALADEPTFINDVAVTKRAAWFTDSQRPQLYRVALGKRGAPARTARTVPFTGELVYDDDPQTFEVNGIAPTPNGRTLLVVQSRTGMLFRVDARSGETTRIPLTGGDGGLLPNADGILLRGTTLYVVQNRLNKIAVVRLERDLSSGAIHREIAHPAFDVPTTIARRGSFLYAPNARFGTTPTSDTEYAVVRVRATP